MSAVFTCSIDDGHPSDMRTAELLHRHGIGGTFFIPVKNREDSNVMSRAEMREVARHFEIGSHTFDHCYLNYVDVREAYYQVAEGKQRLEDLIGRHVSGFCYPGGKYRRRDIELVKACGFQYARTTSNLYLDAGSRPFEIPTTLQFFPHDRGVYLRNFVKWGHWWKREEGLRVALAHRGWIERMHALFDYCCERGEMFHLWWHSKQIDELDAWGQLDAFLRHVADRIPPHDRLSNEQLVARCFQGERIAAAAG